MGVVNGQRADQKTFNDAFLCKANNETVTGIVTLDNPASGDTVANVQQGINDNIANIATNRTDIDSNDVDIADLQATKENKSEKDQPDGYAGLDANGKILPSTVPDGYLVNRGVYDAATNTPTLADGAGTNGDRYRTTVAGSQDLGSGTQNFAVGDTVTYNGTIWEREDFVGVSTYAALTDTDMDTVAPIEADIVQYNATTMKWEPKALPASTDGRQVTLIGRGTAFWNTTADDLVLDSAQFVSVPGLDQSFNRILAQSINMPGANDVAYVDVDFLATAITDLAVTVVDASSFVETSGRYILARRFQGDIYYGFWDPEIIGDGDTVNLGTHDDKYDFIQALDTSLFFQTPVVAQQWYALVNSWSITLLKGTWAVTVFSSVQVSNSPSTALNGVQIALSTSTTAGAGIIKTAFLGRSDDTHMPVNVTFADITVAANTPLYLHVRARSGFGTYGVGNMAWRNDAAVADTGVFMARRVRK